MNKIPQNQKDSVIHSAAHQNIDSAPAMQSLAPPPLQFKTQLSNKSEEEKQEVQFKQKSYAGGAAENPEDNSDDGSAPKQPFQLKVASNNTGLPDNLKTGIEGLSGFSMNDVKVNYNSSKPAQLKAHAYAQGNNIEIGPGQEKHLPHEAWHVVQQKQGRVQPTTQLKAFNINDDVGLEKEADVMGEKANKISLQKKSISPLLSEGSHSKQDQSTVQAKLILDDGTGLKKYSNETHGQEQVGGIIQQNNISGDWQKYLFHTDYFVWDAVNSKWDKASPLNTPLNVPEAEADTLESTKILRGALPYAAVGAAAGSATGAGLGSFIGSTFGTMIGENSGALLGEIAGAWIGFPELGAAFGSTMGTVIGEIGGQNIGFWTGLLGGGAAGGAVGASLKINVPQLVKAKTSEILWKKGIVLDGLDINLAATDIPKLLAGYELDLHPSLSSIKKTFELEGNEILLENLSLDLKLCLKEGPAISVQIPRFTGAIDIILKDADTGEKSTQIIGDVSISNLAIEGGLPFDASLRNVLYAVATRKVTIDQVTSALEASFKCDQITAGLKIETFASDGQSRRGNDLGDDQYDASVDLSNLSAQNTGLKPNDTSGSLGFLAAEVNRTGGKKKASANVHATGEFSSLESLKEAVKGNDAEVHGLKGGALGTGKLAGKAISAGLKKAVDGPNVLIKKKIHKLIHKNGGKMTVPEILAKLPPNYTEKDVVYYCQSLVKSKKLEAQNTSKIKKKLKSFIGKDSKEASYSSKGMDGLQDKLEKVDNIGDKIGKRKAQAGTRIASSAIKDKGLDIGLTGESNDGSTSFTAEVHLDKELVEKGYKLLELVGTVIKSVLPPDEDED